MPGVTASANLPASMLPRLAPGSARPTATRLPAATPPTALAAAAPGSSSKDVRSPVRRGPPAGRARPARMGARMEARTAGATCLPTPYPATALAKRTALRGPTAWSPPVRHRGRPPARARTGSSSPAFRRRRATAARGRRRAAASTGGPIPPPRATSGPMRPPASRGPTVLPTHAPSAASSTCSSAAVWALVTRPGVVRRSPRSVLRSAGTAVRTRPAAPTPTARTVRPWRAWCLARCCAAVRHRRRATTALAVKAGQVVHCLEQAVERRHAV
jgi:hypothetical protein